MEREILDVQSVRKCLCIRDLTDPEAGLHALQLLVDAIRSALVEAYDCPVEVVRQSPIVSVADNYDRLGYAAEAVARDARYTRYVCEGALLRTHTTAMIPSVLRRLATSDARELIVSCPGLVYRRDAIDRRHTGEPHQLDVWMLSRERRLERADLERWITTVVESVLPGLPRRTEPAAHPYTEQGLQIDVRDGTDWLEIGECGLAAPRLLDAHGLPSAVWSGLAMGLGLDRLLMVRKGIPDIRLLRAADPRVAGQMLDLAPYRPVSAMPAVRRDLSLVLDADETLETLGDRVRQSLGPDADVVECVEILADTPGSALAPAVRERLGMSPGQRNVLVRVVLRAYDRTLTSRECNQLRDRIYSALHRGTRSEWAAAPGSR